MQGLYVYYYSILQMEKKKKQRSKEVRNLPKVSQLAQGVLEFESPVYPIPKPQTLNDYDVFLHSNYLSQCRALG